MYTKALTVEEQHLEKLIYTLDTLHDKMIDLGGQLEVMERKLSRSLKGSFLGHGR